MSPNEKNSSLFTDMRDPRLISAVEMLRGLGDRLRRTSATRVYAEALHEDRKKEWTDRRQVKLSKKKTYNLMGESGELIDVYKALNGHDHIDLWIRDGKAVCVTSQPYELRPEHIVALAGFSRRGLGVEVSPRSFYFPGRTLLIEIWAYGVPWSPEKGDIR